MKVELPEWELGFSLLLSRRLFALVVFFKVYVFASSETQGQLVGAGKSLIGREKIRAKKSQERDPGSPRTMYLATNH